MMTRYLLPSLFLCLFFFVACSKESPEPEPTQVMVVEMETAVSTPTVQSVPPTHTAIPSATDTHTPTPTATVTPTPLPTTSIWAKMPTTAVAFDTEVTFEVVNQIGGRITAVQISGNHAYLGIGPRLVVLDVSDGLQPSIVGQSDILPSVVQDIALIDEHAFVSIGENGFWIIDVSQPHDPQVVSFEPQSSAVQKIEHQDDHLFILGKKAGEELKNELVIYSTAELENPVEISRLSLPYQFYGDMILDDERIYVIDEFSSDVHFVDISRAGEPYLIDTFSVADFAVKNLSSKKLYSLETNKLRILDVSDSRQPIEIAQIENLIDDYWEIDNMMVRENYLFVSAWYCDQSPCGATLFAFDLSDPKQVREIARFSIDGGLVDIHVADDEIYLITGSQLLITTLPTEDSWQLLGSFLDYGRYGVFNRLATADNQLYMVNSFGHGVGIFDLEQPEQPVEKGLYRGAFDEITAGNNQMYPTAGWRESLHQVDVQVPSSPWKKAALDDDISVTSPPVLNGNRLYALLNGYLGILDVANSGKMNILNDVDLDPEEYGPYRYIAVSEDIVYAQSHQGISILDVTDPNSVLKIGFIPKDDAMCTLTAKDDYVFVYSTASYCGIDAERRRLTIYDVSNPAVTQMVGRLDLDLPVETMLLKDSNLFLVGDDLKVVDVSQPDSPRFVGFFPTPGKAQSATTSNDLIYVADGAGGVLILRMDELTP